MLSHLANSWLRDPSSIWYLLLGLMNAVFFLDIYIDYRQHRQISIPERPVELVALCSEEEYSKSRNYGMDSSRFDMINKAFQHVLSLILTFGGILPILWHWSEHLVPSQWQGEIPISLVFQSLLLLFHLLTSLPFSVYKTFRLEKRHGFNKTTVSTFIGDRIKSVLLTVLFGSFVMGSIIWIIRQTGNYFALAICAFLLLFHLVMIVIYPTLIQPLFNKFTPLADDSPVKGKIEALASKVNFPLTKIYVIDGSKRSSHSNAYFFGLINKRIVLFDTLLEQVGPDEVVSIVGHELGHWYFNHVLKGLALIQTNVLMIFLLFQLVMNWSPLYLAFGFSQGRPIIIGLTLFQQLLAPAEFIITFLMSYLSRRREFEADRFAIDIGYGKHLPSALIALYRENKNLVHPDWLYSALHHSHPPPSERISAMHRYLALTSRKAK